MCVVIMVHKRYIVAGGVCCQRSAVHLYGYGLAQTTTLETHGGALHFLLQVLNELLSR